MWYKCCNCHRAEELSPSQGRDFVSFCIDCGEERSFHRMERIRQGHDFGNVRVFRCMVPDPLFNDRVKFWFLPTGSHHFYEYKAKES